MKLKCILLFLLLCLIQISCGPDDTEESEGELPKNNPVVPLDVQMIYQGTNYLEFELKTGDFRGSSIEDIKKELETIGNFELRDGLSGNKIIEILRDPTNDKRFKVKFKENFKGGVENTIRFLSEKMERSFDFSFRLSEGIDFSPFAFEDGAVIYDVNIDKGEWSDSNDEFLKSEGYILKHFRPGDEGFDIELAKGDVENWIVSDTPDEIIYRMKISIKDRNLDLRTDDQINLIYTNGYQGFRITVDQTWVAKVRSGVDAQAVCISLDKTKFTDNNTFCMGTNGREILGIDKTSAEVSEKQFIYPEDTAEPTYIKDFVFDETSASSDFACGYNSVAKKVYCWGNYSFPANMGNNITTEFGKVNKPVESSKEIEGYENTDYKGYFTVDSKIKSFESGYTLSCLENILGELYCWGQNFGEDENNEFKFGVNSIGPVRVSKAGEVIKGYTVGNKIACYINQADQEICYTHSGKEFFGDTTNSAVTVFSENKIKIQGYLAGDNNEIVISLGAGSGNYCGILENPDGGRRIKCRGNNPITGLPSNPDGADFEPVDTILNEYFGLQAEENFTKDNFYPNKIYVSQNTVCLASAKKEIKCKRNEESSTKFPPNFGNGTPLFDAKTSIKSIVPHDAGICLETEVLESVQESEHESYLKGKIYCYGGIGNQYPFDSSAGRDGELKIPVR